jgi:alpha-tubulin suppressor-like RCC1 family protein
MAFLIISSPSLTELQKLRLTAENQSNFEVISFSLGTDHMCVVTRTSLKFSNSLGEGKVYSAGRGNEGQLGREILKSQDKVTAFKLSPIKKEEQELLSYPLCEVDLFGKLIKATMVACGDKFTIVLSRKKTFFLKPLDKNKVYAFGDGSNGCLGLDTGKTIYIRTPTEISALSDKKIIGIAAGPKHSACISFDGDLFCWGSNYYAITGEGRDQKMFYLYK